VTEQQRAKLKALTPYPTWETRMHLKLTNGHSYGYRCEVLKSTKSAFNEYKKGRHVGSHVVYMIDDDETKFATADEWLNALEAKGIL